MSIDRAAATPGSSCPETCQEVAIPSSLLEAPDEVVGHPLSASEASFFKEHGYLVKQGLLKTALLQPALDYVWQRAPSCINCLDPTSYTHSHRLWERTAVNGERGGLRLGLGVQAVLLHEALVLALGERVERDRARVGEHRARV